MRNCFPGYLLTVFCILHVQLSWAQEPLNKSTVAFTSKAIPRVAAGETYKYVPVAIDSAGGKVILSAAVAPAWLQFEGSGGILTGSTNKPGQYPVMIIATNGKDSARQQFMLTVYNNGTKNILCLGNSITNGTSVFNSYRRPLWKLLHDHQYNFDFIGSWNKHHMGGAVPNPDFDTDHEGHSGWTLEHVFHPPDWDSARGNIHDWLRTYKPDLVLLELGTNDVFQCRKVGDMLKNLSDLIIELRKSNASVTIFIAQIPPLGAQWSDKKLCGDSVTYDQAIHYLNNAIPPFSKAHTTHHSRIIIVDQYSGVNPSTDMYDDIHPNTKGEIEMAQRWFRAIRKFVSRIPAAGH